MNWVEVVWIVMSAASLTLGVKAWKTDVKPAPDAFAFARPAKAHRLGPDALIGLDELPPDASTGAKR